MGLGVYNPSHVFITIWLSPTAKIEHHLVIRYVVNEFFDWDFYVAVNSSIIKVKVECVNEASLRFFAQNSGKLIVE